MEHTSDDLRRLAALGIMDHHSLMSESASKTADSPSSVKRGVSFMKKSMDTCNGPSESNEEITCSGSCRRLAALEITGDRSPMSESTSETAKTPASVKRGMSSPKTEEEKKTEFNEEITCSGDLRRLFAPLENTDDRSSMSESTSKPADSQIRRKISENCAGDGKMKLSQAIITKFGAVFMACLSNKITHNCFLSMLMLALYARWVTLFTRLVLDAPSIYSVLVPTEFRNDWIKVSLPSSKPVIQQNTIISSISMLSGIRGTHFMMDLRILTVGMNICLLMAVRGDLVYRGRNLFDIETHDDMIPVSLMSIALGLFFLGHFELNRIDHLHTAAHMVGVIFTALGSSAIGFALHWSVLSVLLIIISAGTAMAYVLYTSTVEQRSDDIHVVTQRSKTCLLLEIAFFTTVTLNGALAVYASGPNGGSLWVSPFTQDPTPFINGVVKLIAYALFVGPFIISFSLGGKFGTFRKIYPNDTLVAHDIAYSRAKHHHVVNKAIHVVTNPLIIISLFSILDNTPTLAQWPARYFIELNGAGLYFLCLMVYHFYFEPSFQRASAVNIALLVCYTLRLPLQVMMGKENLLWYFVLYIISQGLQVFPGHILFDRNYAHCDHHLFILQQYLHWVQVLVGLGFFKEFRNESDELVHQKYQHDPHKQPEKLENVDSVTLAIARKLHWLNLHIMPHYSQFDIDCLPPIAKNILSFVGLIPLIIHRYILNIENLKHAPLRSRSTISMSISKDHVSPLVPPKFRPSDGYGTDINNPTTAATGSALGRNMYIVPKHLRNHRADPDVQLVAQRLLAREGFVPAGDQLNIIAAAWIHAQVHGWVGHRDGNPTELSLGKGICPMNSFTFPETKERHDGHYDSERSQWWDASFLYGQTKHDVGEIRSFAGGKLKVNSENPNLLATRPDGTYFVGDNKNSWIGISLLQNLFLNEHNLICDKLAEKYPKMCDDELFGYTRNIIAAMNAKIHTIDWTVELLKTNMLELGMKTNWIGLTKSIFGKNAPGTPFQIIKKTRAKNHDIPFCLTEEFAAVYRLHPLCPPGIILDDSEFISFDNLLGADGRDTLRRSDNPVAKIMYSMYAYPCGHLVGSNYPDALRDVKPSDEIGNDLTGIGRRIDLAAIDLYRDRERGIPLYQDFRRKLHLKPWSNWEEMTGDKQNAMKLELIYGPAPGGIERCDLLVGDLYEKKLKGFAISETSFIVFLLMASRRLDADPFLNEFYDEEHYTSFGLDYIECTDGLLDLLKRHQPETAVQFVAKNQSAFKPLFGAEKWNEAVKNGIIDPELVRMWADTKKDNEDFFESLQTGVQQQSVPRSRPRATEIYNQFERALRSDREPSFAGQGGSHEAT